MADNNNKVILQDGNSQRTKKSNDGGLFLTDVYFPDVSVQFNTVNHHGESIRDQDDLVVHREADNLDDSMTQINLEFGKTVRENPFKKLDFSKLQPRVYPKEMANPFGKGHDAEDLPELSTSFLTTNVQNFKTGHRLKTVLNKSVHLRNKFTTYRKSHKFGSIDWEMDKVVTQGEPDTFSNKSSERDKMNKTVVNRPGGIQRQALKTDIGPLFPMRKKSPLTTKNSAVKGFPGINTTLNRSKMKTNLSLLEQGRITAKVDATSPMMQSVEVTSKKSRNTTDLLSQDGAVTGISKRNRITASKQRESSIVELSEDESIMTELDMMQNRQINMFNAINKRDHQQQKQFYKKCLAKNSEREVGFTRDLRNTRVYYYKKGQALRDQETEIFHAHMKKTYDKELKKDVKLIQSIPASLIGKDLKEKLSRTVKVVMSHTKEFNIQKKEAQDLALPFIIQRLKDQDKNEKMEQIKAEQLKDFQQRREEMKRKKKLQEQMNTGEWDN